MKILLILFFFIAANVNAQTWQEWTQQRKTQIKYLLNQIAANKVYIEYLQKGYSIANKGLTTIRNIKNGEFNLHRDFFGSLKLMNPKIKKYVKIANIIAYQVSMIKETKKTLQGIRETGQFTGDELDYCKMVFDNLLEECLKSIDELLLIITPGEVALTNEERLKRIERLYTDMQNKYTFCSSFSEEMGLLSVQRLGEQLEINRSKLRNGFK